mgnify:CR=1 FL=1
MAFNNGSIISLVNFVKNIDINGGDTNEDEWGAIITANSQKLFSKLLGVPDLYQIGAPLERRGVEISRAAEKKLRPFLVRETVGVVGGSVDVTGKNMGYFLACEPTTISGRGFDELSPSEVADRLGDPVVAPTVDDPCLEYASDTNILVYPSSLSQVVLKYYTFPTDAVVVFQTDSNTLKKTYNAGASTETGWEKEELIEIAFMCLRDAGMNVNRQDVAQYANQIVANE